MSGTTTIRRSQTAAGRTRSGSGRRPAVKRVSTADRLVALIPLSERTLARIITALIALALTALLWIGAQFLGLPQIALAEFARVASNAGFQVKKVEVHGVQRMDEMMVYAIALDEVDRSMVTLDLARVRNDVQRLGWVSDARVSRRLPDTLVVDIIERQPSAIWQHDGQLRLIDAEGNVLEAVDRRSVPDLPLVVGPQANRKAPALARLLEAAPALKPMVAGATWIGNRRWDIRFQSGETLLLPEGEAEAADALAEFAQADGVNRLLGRGILRVDMRDPANYVLRLPRGRVQTDTGDDVVEQPSQGGADATTDEGTDRGAEPDAGTARTESRQQREG